MNKEFKPYFDINDTGLEVIARVFQEERKNVSPSMRVVHAEDYFRSRIYRDNWQYNLHSQAEKKATINAFELFDSGCQMAIWISPQSEIYEEGRINVMLFGEKGGEKFFETYGMPLLEGEEKSMEMGEKLIEKGGVVRGNINEIDDLREQPIAFYLRGEEWLKKCQELLPELSWAWETIALGKVDENMKKIALEVQMAREKAGKNNYLFEIIMAQRGYLLNISGSHGGSWLSQDLGREQGIIALNIGGKIEYRLGRTEGLKHCEKCGCWYSGEKCPVCNK